MDHPQPVAYCHLDLQEDMVRDCQYRCMRMNWDEIRIEGKGVKRGNSKDVHIIMIM